MDDKFYSDAKDYWEKVPSTLEGMLGGFSHLSSTDLGGSNKFLRPFLIGNSSSVGRGRCVDCGAGIGRITKGLLTKYFDKVDLVEQDTKFTKEAAINLESCQDKVGNIINIGLQDFHPEPGTYDVIWVQWVLGHLTDAHLVSFFKGCKKGLKENGIIVVKENTSEETHFDDTDSSFTRPKNDLIRLINESGLNIIKEERQKNFPKQIYDVFMFALQ